METQELQTYEQTVQELEAELNAVFDENIAPLIEPYAKKGALTYLLSLTNTLGLQEKQTVDAERQQTIDGQLNELNIRTSKAISLLEKYMENPLPRPTQKSAGAKPKEKATKLSDSKPEPNVSATNQAPGTIPKANQAKPTMPSAEENGQQPQVQEFDQAVIQSLIDTITAEFVKIKQNIKGADTSTPKRNNKPRPTPSDWYESDDEPILQMVNKTKVILRALPTYHYDVTSWDPILIYCLTTKLDPRSLRKWNDQIKKRSHIHLGEMIDFLEVQGVENLPDRTELSKSDRKNTRSGKQWKKGSRTVLVTTTIPSKCIQCAGDHPVFRCKTFNELNVQDRIKRCRNEKVCLKCLNKHAKS